MQCKIIRPLNPAFMLFETLLWWKLYLLGGIIILLNKVTSTPLSKIKRTIDVSITLKIHVQCFIRTFFQVPCDVQKFTHTIWSNNYCQLKYDIWTFEKFEINPSIQNLSSIMVQYGSKSHNFWTIFHVVQLHYFSFLVKSCWFICNPHLISQNILNLLDAYNRYPPFVFRLVLCPSTFFIDSLSRSQSKFVNYKDVCRWFEPISVNITQRHSSQNNFIR